MNSDAKPSAARSGGAGPRGAIFDITGRGGSIAKRALAASPATASALSSQRGHSRAIRIRHSGRAAMLTCARAGVVDIAQRSNPNSARDPAPARAVAALAVAAGAGAPSAEETGAVASDVVVSSAEGLGAVIPPAGASGT